MIYYIQYSHIHLNEIHLIFIIDWMCLFLTYSNILSFVSFKLVNKLYKSWLFPLFKKNIVHFSNQARIAEENLIKKTKSHMSIYVFCDLYPKLQIQLQQFTESYSDFDCYWMESMGNLNFWIMSDQIVEKIYACVIFYCRCMYVVCYL